MNKIILLSAAAIALPFGAASAQVAAEAGAAAQTTQPAQTTPPAQPVPPAEGPLDTVETTVDTAADAAQPTAPDPAAAAQAEAPAPATTPLVAATAADVKTGEAVHDVAGELVGKIESVTAQGAVIATGKSRVQVPIASFGKNDKGLVISLTKAELDAEAEAKKPS